ncbi:MAG: asparagine synthase (glutamine-hydrolyzing) [Mycobacterium sp.]|nr:asparagine synthase (glutamine-hydrolyzing) [Mycobacterium sp.]
MRRFDGEGVDPIAVRRMAEHLSHRGPDEMGVWIDDSVAFAHARLSIIDLGSSHQPMATDDGLVHLVFNGEILNYRDLRGELSYPFRTDGDTEVLLAIYRKYGPAGVSHLRGQFAYAIHDAATAETHLFRDRLGILPLYYYSDRNFFVFASEIKALLPLLPERSVDDESLHDYLSHRVVPAPYTLIRGVRKVLPGHHLVVCADGTVTTEPYWQVPNNPPTLKIAPDEAIRRIDETLTDSVREALIADVPVGLYLSGGVDSSLLTALAAREHGNEALHTFSASFGEHRLDESAWARKVAGIFRTTHHEVAVTAEDFQNNWAKLSWHRDGPLSEPADVAIYHLAKLAREQVKVVLSGEGSDELFGGYPKYRYARQTRWLGGRPASGLLRLVERSLPAGKSRLRIAVRALSEPSHAERMRAWFAPFSGAERHRLLGGLPARTVLDPYLRGHGDALQQMLYADMFTWLSDNLLERGDRMSMAASLETRPPFLDYRLVELAYALPSRYKVRRGTTKWILKQVALKHLPAEVVNRPKIGFKVPLNDWFRGGLRDYAYDCLTGPSSYVGARFSKSEIVKLLDAHLSGSRNEENRIWTLLSLEVWHRDMLARGWF